MFGKVVDALPAVQDDGRHALALVTGDVPTIEGTRAAWLHEKRERSGSAKTERAYADAFDSYRAACQATGLDVDAPNARKLALVLQAWASRPRERDGRPVTASTANQRRACISSFYTYARRFGLTVRGYIPNPNDPDEMPRLVENPATLTTGKPVQGYAYARPLDRNTVSERLAAIDRTTPAGMRDYALLQLGLRTGRRVAELAALTYGDLTRHDGRFTVTWRHCKGGKVMHDELTPDVSEDIDQWLYAAYGADLGTLPHEAPVFVSLARNGTRGHQLTGQAVADICQKRLGTSKVHALRHTFSKAMRDAGAPVEVLQARLGHSNLATTSRYLHALDAAENPYADRLAAMFQPTPRPRSGRITRPLSRNVPR